MQNARLGISDTKKRFFAEMIGTFVVVVCATGSVVANAQSGGKIGLWYEAFAPFVAVSVMVFLFGKISMAHFNPAVTLVFLITRHMPARLLPVYLGAEFIGAFLASVFVWGIVGSDANLGANVPNYHYDILEILGIEILATVILISMILLVVHTKGLKRLGPVAIGSMIFFDIYFLSFVSGASMNPIRALAPAVFSGFLNDLWIYWSAPFIGAAIIGIIYKKKFVK
ncbi:MAG: MIP/aquaporin family protein [Candidatus Nitrosotenuis sp.]